MDICGGQGGSRKDNVQVGHIIGHSAIFTAVTEVTMCSPGLRVFSLWSLGHRNVFVMFYVGSLNLSPSITESNRDYNS